MRSEHVSPYAHHHCMVVFITFKQEEQPFKYPQHLQENYFKYLLLHNMAIKRMMYQDKFNGKCFNTNQQDRKGYKQCGDDCCLLCHGYAFVVSIVGEYQY